MKIQSEERFVPHHYKTGSIETRLHLLAGILDGDGHLHRTDFDFISKSARLANDVAFIARSLGLAAYVTPCRKGCQGGFVGDYFRVCVSGATDKLPMRIPRKQPPARKMKKNPLVVGFSIRELDDEPFYGFTLDGDHRYLLDDFTITHNSGKTIVSAEIMARVHKGSGEKSLFIAHRDELLSQTIDKVRLVSPDTRVGLVQAKRDEVGREITVASIATIGHRGGARLKKLLDHGPYKVVVIDEAHHAVGAQYMKVIDALREANPGMLLMGMTATPGRADGIAMDRVFDVVAYEKNTFEMIRDGWLVPPHGFRVDIDIDLDKVETGNGDYVVTQLSKLMNTPYVNRAVVEAWRAYGHDRKCIVFACDVAHAQALAQEFIDAGHPAAAVDGKMKDKDRKDALNRFREGSIKLLVNCNVLIEGYDDPSAEGIVFARPTQSQSLYVQALGRSLRLFPGKTEALIIDCVGNSEKHRPVQLASLAGFDPERKHAGNGGLGEGEEEEEDLNEDQTEVTGAKIGDATEVTFGARKPKGQYQWRETTLGWILQIPRIGYYLVAWSDKAKHMATIRFFDQRSGRKHDPPREVVRQPVEFDLAYGLVESEMDRIFRARSMRRDEGGKIDAEVPLASFVDLDEGTDEDVSPPEEELMLKDAAWRDRPVSAKQRELLVSLGVKEKTMPDNAGEASDLITIMRVERDMKMRVPATLKQINYLRFHGLPLGENLTKGMAARAIWMHRKATGR